MVTTELQNILAETFADCEEKAARYRRLEEEFEGESEALVYSGMARAYEDAVSKLSERVEERVSVLIETSS